ncbi:MAG: lamin tail domain-containing protein [Bacteroidetes bacterium]|nr:lamin tail domain-containing protein [Bacteroidota bacterium]
MRFTLPLLTLVMSFPLLIQAQCSDIFISEYCEGTGNNKGVEFYNPTGEAIDLSSYQLQRWSNGEGTATDWVDLIGTIEAYGTWVLVNGQTEDVDLGGGATSPACDPAMQAYADQLDNPYPAPTYMNGDDALVLVKNETTVVDIFGKPGEDPGVAWTNDEANGFIDIGDGAAWLTSNHTLRRKYDVMQGVTVPPVSFNTFLEWDTLSVNTWDGLGMHACGCNPNSIEQFHGIETSVFPNPSNTGSITIQANAAIQGITVHSADGKLIREENLGTGIRQFDLSGLLPGSYFVNLRMTAGQTFAHRILVQ